MRKKVISLLLALTMLSGLLAGCAAASDDEAAVEGFFFQKTASDEEAFGQVEFISLLIEARPHSACFPSITFGFTLKVLSHKLKCG